MNFPLNIFLAFSQLANYFLATGSGSAEDTPIATLWDSIPGWDSSAQLFTRYVDPRAPVMLNSTKGHDWKFESSFPHGEPLLFLPIFSGSLFAAFKLFTGTLHLTLATFASSFRWVLSHIFNPFRNVGFESASSPNETPAPQVKLKMQEGLPNPSQGLRILTGKATHPVFCPRNRPHDLTQPLLWIPICFYSKVSGCAARPRAHHCRRLDHSGACSAPLCCPQLFKIESGQEVCAFQVPCFFECSLI